MRHLDLFSGIGGFALAARWMGWETVAFCEIEPYPQAVLRKHWPDVPIFDDVRTLNATELAGLGRIDLITGGVPCQPHSVAGLRRGRDDPRHLWPDTARIIKKARPSWCVIENVVGLRSTAADEYLSDLESLGYACWPVVVGAVHAGAPHRRQRVWIVAHAESQRWRGRVEPPQDVEHNGFQLAHLGADAADAKRPEWRPDQAQPAGGQQAATVAGDGCRHAADAGRELLEDGRAARSKCGRQRSTERGDIYQPDWRGWTDAPSPTIPADAKAAPHGKPEAGDRRQSIDGGSRRDQDGSSPESRFRSLDDGLPAGLAGGCRVQKLKALGNAIVPQVAYEIFRAIDAAVRD